MSLKQFKITSVSSALLLGALAPASWAQGAIVPTDGATPSSAPVPSRVSAPASNTLSGVDLRFQDVSVPDLLNLIADYANVPVIVNGDVDGIIKSINLSNKSAESAIQAICMVANIGYRKQPDGTYLISKALYTETPAAAPAITAPEPTVPLNVIPNNFGFSNRGGFTGGDSLPQLGSEPAEMPALVGLNPTKERKSTHEIALRNVSPGLMAYWLDPTHNELPQVLRVMQLNEDDYRRKYIGQPALSPTDQMAAQGIAGVQGSSPFAGMVNPGSIARGESFDPYLEARAQFGGGRGGGGGIGGGRGGAAGGRGGQGSAFQLPEGVDTIVAIDPQNALMVFGTDEGVRDLQETINFLDRPLKQVEIECQFVTVSTQDSRAFGIDFSTSQGNFNASNTGFAPSGVNGSFSLGFVRGNFRAALTSLLTRNRAKIITAPRITAINNLTASLQSTTSRPVVLTTAVQGGGIGGGTAQGQNLIYIPATIGLTVTPTINNDDTVTVMMQPQVQQLTVLQDVGAPLQSSQSLVTIANVRDGDTIALGGLKSKDISRGGARVPLLGDIPLVGKLFRSRAASDGESELIIFLTARIIRRAGDDAVVPGT